jgi:hypothetical protein
VLFLSFERIDERESEEVVVQGWRRKPAAL